MAWLEFSPSQNKILNSLIHLYEKHGGYIKGTLIAESTGFESDIVHSQMEQFKTLQLVEGVVGPVGAYKPTIGAYEVLKSLEDR